MTLQNKKIMVTGGAGFIGSSLVRELIKEQAEVLVYDNFSSGSLKNISEVEDKITIIEGDIRDKNLPNILRKNEIQFLFNLAALPYIPDCYEKPFDFLDVNTMGALNVFLSVKEAGVERMIQYSTSEVYGTAINTPMDEHHPTLPQSSYAAAKLAAERVAYTMYHEQQIPIIILRQFNSYGPRGTHPYVIPEIISQLSKSNQINLGNLNARRDFVYVSDAAKASVALIKHKQAVGEVFNCGSGDDYSIKELAELTAEIMGVDNLKINIDQSRLRPLDVHVLKANFFKCHQLTKWVPTVSIKDGLKETVDWFNSNGKTWPWINRKTN
ncbi:SDR family NAD(P)-dependent oxidoreductase [Candidatus Woesearchaeota archaeon]|nr:SDR family NAD(P)-dependent oxidoreductase [Candidatus Woesearchaeota archaeon]